MSATNGRSLGPNTINALLANPDRRHLLSVLRENGSATVEELSHLIAARKRDTLPDGGADVRRCVAVALIHNHLPRLADSGVVEYDPPDGIVVPAENFAVLVPFVTLLERQGDTRYRAT